MTKTARWRPGTVALRQIRKYQKSTSLLIPRKGFMRLVKEITHEIDPEVRFQSTAVMALQEAAEAFLTNLFKDSQDCAIHAKRVTVRPEDLRLRLKIRNI